MIINHGKARQRHMGLGIGLCVIVGLMSLVHAQVPASHLAGAQSLHPNKPYVICIDPGHPSEVGRGTTGRHISEIQAVWLVANLLRDDLQKRGMRVVMTKQSEYQFVRNRTRAEIANDAHADMMIRLHCDSDAGTGIATYAPFQPGVNAGFHGPSPSIIAESVAMDKVFHAVMIKDLHGTLRDRGLLPETMTAVGAKQGALTGSIYSKVPVVLVEMCVLTNPSDERFILRASNQQLLADAMADGIEAALRASPVAHN